MITYHQLRTFLVVLRAGSLTKAARELNATQPSVSLQLRALQEYLGTRLIARDRSGLRLTAGGEKLRQYAEDVLAGLRTLQQDIAALDRTLGGPLAVGMTFMVERYLLPGALFRFREQYPNVDVQLQVELPEPLFRALAGNTLDVMCYVNVHTPPGLVVEPVGTEEMVLVASSAHRLASRPRVTPKDLSAESFVAPLSRPLRDLLEAKLRGIGVTVRANAVGSHHDAIKKLVENHLGYSLLIKSSVAEEVARGRLVILRLDKPPIMTDVVMACQSRSGASPLVQEFIRFVRGELARRRSVEPARRRESRLRQRA